MNAVPGAAVSGSAAPIGVFDSGVGGLSVWRELRRQLPQESLIYVADQAHVPYGARPLAELRAFADGISDFLLEAGCKAVVVACNTASAAALHTLRERLPQVPFIGMEPAVKPAAGATRSGVVAVLATPGTLQGELMAHTAARFASHVRVLPQPCPGLVECIERGAPEAETEALLRERLQPLLDAGADHVVLACTHYPFVKALIERIAGPGVSVVDPAPAVARHVGTVLERQGLRAVADAPQACVPQDRYCSSADPQVLQAFLRERLAVQAAVEALHWQGGRLLPTPQAVCA